jgi:hypothetical protein
MGRSEASTSVVKWSAGLRNRVSIIVRRYVDQMKFAAHMTVHHIFHILLLLFRIIVRMVVCCVCFCF